MPSKGFLVLVWLTLVKAVAIYLFTRGFLLSRLSLPNRSLRNATLEPTRTRAVLLIIDALRFDFIAPYPPTPSSPLHHGILTLPRELTEREPANSFIFDAFADPPTATLQRIKAITTGSLPTFIDIGSNFGGAAVTEDSLISQLRAAGKNVAFAGDDTWLTVFPDALQPNLTFAYDSFNVEDLHTVDLGVISHLFPLLEQREKRFDLLIGHFLGVDHVGHRVGPDHPSMKAKLAQMNHVLEDVVRVLDEDTVLIVMGDHGMDRSGDHGGDGDLETSSALWIYAKGPPMALPLETVAIPESLIPLTTFPGSNVPHRRVQQIDLVPSLALLLGLPIPFGNLGTIIPELFSRSDEMLSSALRINAAQIKRYLDAYRGSVSGGELDGAWAGLRDAWVRAEGGKELEALHAYTRLALSTCRELWAQFDPVLMAMGLVLLLVSVLTTAFLFYDLREKEGETVKVWDRKIRAFVRKAVRGGLFGSVLGFCSYLALGRWAEGVTPLDSILFGASLASCFIHLRPSLPLPPFPSFPLLLLLLHSSALLSNSFTFWEDRLVTFLLLSSLLPSLLIALRAPTHASRLRILCLIALFATCVRSMAAFSVCREEQGGYCQITFYAPSSVASPPLFVLLLAFPVSQLVPRVISRFLRRAKAGGGVAELVLGAVMPFVLGAGTIGWVLEWVEIGGALDALGVGGEGGARVVRVARTLCARLGFSVALLGGWGMWALVPTTYTVLKPASPSSAGMVRIDGLGNAYGAPFVVFWTVGLGLVWGSMMLSAQIVLALGTVAFLAYLEILDGVRDILALEIALSSASPSTAILALDHVSSSDPFGTSTPGMPKPLVQPETHFGDVVPLALLGLHMFFRTGHQMTISSIQWKTAFLLTEGVFYPFSPFTVGLNTFGGVFLGALGVGGVGMWNRMPRAAMLVVGPDDHEREGEGDVRIYRDTLRASLGLTVYHSTLLFGSSFGAAVLRRHLMVWKVFAPRFMGAVAGAFFCDFGVLIGVGVGLGWIGGRLEGVFRGERGKR